MIMTRSRLIALVLVTLCGSAIVVGLYRAGAPPFATAAPPAQTVPTRPYRFPSVEHIPEETARARLVCAQAGDYAWSVARRRERTGLTLEEALALLTQEHGTAPDFRPREYVTYIAYYAGDAGPPWSEPEKVRGFMQRMCLKDMLGSLAEPKAEAPTQPPPPAPPRKGKSK
jgi:hypothetical protein